MFSTFSYLGRQNLRQSYSSSSSSSSALKLPSPPSFPPLAFLSPSIYYPLLCLSPSCTSFPPPPPPPPLVVFSLPLSFPPDFIPLSSGYFSPSSNLLLLSTQSLSLSFLQVSSPSSGLPPLPSVLLLFSYHFFFLFMQLSMSFSHSSFLSSSHALSPAMNSLLSTFSIPNVYPCLHCTIPLSSSCSPFPPLVLLSIVLHLSPNPFPYSRPQLSLTSLSSFSCACQLFKHT